MIFAQDFKEQTLSDREQALGTLAGATYGTKIYYPEDVKDFIKETLSDIEGGYEGEELLVRIRKRAGEKLCNT